MGCGASLPASEVFLGQPLDAPVSKPLIAALTAQTTVAIKQKFLSLSSSDFTVKDKEGNLVAKLDGKNMSLRTRTVLMDAQGEHVACILEKVFSMSPSFFVYSFSPRYEGQQPTDETQYDKPLYAYAKIWKKNMSIKDEFHICMCTKDTGDNEYEKAAEGSFEGKAPGTMSPKCSITYKGKGCALVDRKVLDWGDLIGTNAYTVTMAPGVDPMLMIAFVAIKDKIMEQQQQNSG